MQSKPADEGSVACWECAALLFDMDGVLIDSRGSVERGWVAWAEHVGLVPADVLAEIHGRRTLEVIALLRPELDAFEQAAFVDRAQMAGAATAIGGAAELLAALPSTRWAVVTSASRSMAAARLRETGMPVPSVLVAAEDVADGKPAPEGYLAAARALGADPVECVVFEDSPLGIEAGVAAGARVVGLTTTFPRERLTRASTVVRDLGDVRSDASDDSVHLKLKLDSRP